MKECASYKTVEEEVNADAKVEEISNSLSTKTSQNKEHGVEMGASTDRQMEKKGQEGS